MYLAIANSANSQFDMYLVFLDVCIGSLTHRHDDIKHFTAMYNSSKFSKQTVSILLHILAVSIYVATFYFKCLLLMADWCNKHFI